MSKVRVDFRCEEDLKASFAAYAAKQGKKPTELYVQFMEDCINGVHTNQKIVHTKSEVIRKGVTPKRVNAKNSSKRVNLSDWGI